MNTAHPMMTRSLGVAGEDVIKAEAQADGDSSSTSLAQPPKVKPPALKSVDSAPLSMLSCLPLATPPSTATRFCAVSDQSIR